MNANIIIMVFDLMIANEEREALSAVGSTITQLLSILKQIFIFAYHIYDKFLTLLNEKPIEFLMSMGSLYILLT